MSDTKSTIAILMKQSTAALEFANSAFDDMIRYFKRKRRVQAVYDALYIRHQLALDTYHAWAKMVTRHKERGR